MVEIVNLKFVQNIFWGVTVGVMVLILLAIKEIWKKSVVDKFSCIMFFVIFILSASFKISPAILVIFAIIIGAWLEFSKNIRFRGKAK